MKNFCITNAMSGNAVLVTAYYHPVEFSNNVWGLLLLIFQIQSVNVPSIEKLFSRNLNYFCSYFYCTHYFCVVIIHFYMIHIFFYKISFFGLSVFCVLSTCSSFWIGCHRYGLYNICITNIWFYELQVVS